MIRKLLRRPGDFHSDLDRRTSRSDRFGSRAGVSLIEAAISVSLLTLLIVPIYGLLYQSRQTVAEGRYQSIARIAAEAQIERIKNIAQRSEADFGALAAFLSTNADNRGRFNVPGLPGWVGTKVAPYATENGNNNGRIRVCLDEGVLATTAGQYFTNGAPEHDNYFSCPPFTTVPNPAWHLDLDNSAKAVGTAWQGPLAATGNYRILPIRVEVYWGFRNLVGTTANDMAPKVAINAVIAPKFNFRRG